MKIAIINDTHWGIKNSSDFFLNYLQRYFDEVFFPECKARGVKTIIHLGDYFDNRKAISIKCLNRSRQSFLNKVRENGMTMHIIPGNHDVAYKNTNDVCSLKETLGYYTDCIKLYMKPAEVQFDKMRVLFMPWITQDNEQECYKAFNDSAADIVASHLELSGFDMMRGVKSHHEDGRISKALLSKFTAVLSGHFHTKSSNGNIHYLGTQYELTWSDYNDPKYLNFIDTETLQLETVKNTNPIFRKFIFDGDDPFCSGHILNAESLNDKYVKLIVKNKPDSKLFDDFITSMVHKHDMASFEIIDDVSSFAYDQDFDLDNECTDTTSTINQYIDNTDTTLNKEKLKSIMHNAFLIAQSKQAHDSL
jgi:DNA repair exonuclease SbcCD nuclease subunit